MIAKQSKESVIKAKPRDASSVSPKVIRREGLLPIVVYSKEMKEAIPLTVNFDTFMKLYKETGEATIIDLEIEGETQPRPVLIKTLQYDPLTDVCIHADLYEIKAGEKLRTTVPLRFKGESPAVKELEGIFIVNKDEVEIECLPKDLPRDIEVDISVLEKIDDSLTVKDIKIPSGVEILDEPDESLVVVSPPAEEEPEEVISEEEAVAAVEATGEKSEGEPGEDEQQKEEKSDEKE